LAFHVTPSQPLLLDLVLQVRQQSDIVVRSGSEGPVTDLEIAQWLNVGLSEVYDLITDASDDYYVNIQPFQLRGPGQSKYTNYAKDYNDITTANWTTNGIYFRDTGYFIEDNTNTGHYVEQVVTGLGLDQYIAVAAEFYQPPTDPNVGLVYLDNARLSWGNDYWVDVNFTRRTSDASPATAHIIASQGGMAELRPVKVNGMDVGWYRVVLRINDKNQHGSGTVRVYSLSAALAPEYLGKGHGLAVRNVGVLQPIYSDYFVLPEEFYKCLRVDKSYSGSGLTANDWFGLDRINVRDEALFNLNSGRTINFPRVSGYLIQDNMLKIVPSVTCAGVYRILYYPAWQDLELTSRVDCGPPGAHWEHMAVMSACAKVAVKRQQDPGPFMAQKQEQINRVTASAKDRNFGRAEPPPVSGVPWYDRGLGGGFGGGLGGF
jgi:hypothetical protein